VSRKRGGLSDPPRVGNVVAVRSSRLGSQPALAAGLPEWRPPQRGRTDALDTTEQKAKELLAQADAYRELFSSLAHDDDTPSA
jgi:hypothetical protein